MDHIEVTITCCIHSQPNGLSCTRLSVAVNGLPSNHVSKSWRTNTLRCCTYPASTGCHKSVPLGIPYHTTPGCADTADLNESLHKKWSFQLRISPFTGEILDRKLHFLCSNSCVCAVRLSQNRTYQSRLSTIEAKVVPIHKFCHPKVAVISCRFDIITLLLDPFTTTDQYKLKSENFTNRSSHRRCSIKKVFSCEFCEISNNTFSTEHLWTTASIQIYNSLFLLFCCLGDIV